MSCRTTQPIRTIFGLLVAGGVVTPILTGCASDPPPQMPAYGMLGQPQQYDDIGTYTRTVSTTSEKAQGWFNHGMTWLYGFNHDEAVLCFRKATEYDPDCAMAWWGIAHAQGPNYNVPMMWPSRDAAAWDALQRAIECMDSATPVEQDLIDALTHRYADPPPADRAHLDAAFAQAMERVWSRHPNDPDVGTIYAESLMTKYPWMLYDRDGTPARGETNTIVAVLERVLAMDANNPGANHLYIHAIEPSNDKGRATPAADRLCDMVPISGHLQHMPSHIYVQTGEWSKSIEQNKKSMVVDAIYRERSPGHVLQEFYLVHNAHMLAFSAMMIGREDEAMAAARAMWDEVPIETMGAIAPFVDPWMCSVYDVQKRFGRWDDLLAEPAPPTYLPVTTAVWRAHRAIAYAAKKDFENATAEHMRFRDAMKNIPNEPMWNTHDTAMKFLLTSDLFISGEIALQQGEWNKAATLLEDAVAIESTLGYGEPPLWLQPVRHTLGAVYLRAERYADAERVYREDLERWPGNGWSLFGLARALEMLDRDEEAMAVRERLDAAWADADEPITTSCKCIPVT